MKFSKAMGQHDHSYKMLFSHAELVRDLLEGFIRQDWIKHLNLDSLEKVSCSFIAIRRVQQADENPLLKWSERFLTCDSLDNFFQGSE